MKDIRLASIEKSYDGRSVLRGLDYVFPGGSVTCILGPSGIGKTTLLRILAGLETPDTGTVTGRPERIAFVFQEDRLAEDFNAVSNIALAAEKGVSGEKIEGELRRLGIDDFKKPVRDFSGGMKRRVAILRAVMSGADLFLLDEPFKGLDERLRETVMDYVRDKTSGKTVICVTHDPKEAERLGARVLVLG